MVKKRGFKTSTSTSTTTSNNLDGGDLDSINSKVSAGARTRKRHKNLLELNTVELKSHVDSFGQIAPSNNVLVCESSGCILNSTESLIVCSKCNYGACRKCVQIFIVTRMEEGHKELVCMKCFDIKPTLFLYEHVVRSESDFCDWYQKTYKSAWIKLVKAERRKQNGADSSKLIGLIRQRKKIMEIRETAEALYKFRMSQQVFCQLPEVEKSADSYLCVLKSWMTTLVQDESVGHFQLSASLQSTALFPCNATVGCCGFIVKYSDVKPEPQLASYEEKCLFLAQQLCKDQSTANTANLITSTSSSMPSTSFSSSSLKNDLLGQCNVCQKFVCTWCEELLCSSSNPSILNSHQCSEAVLNNLEESREGCARCPGCRCLVCRASGCDNMFCLNCNTKFKWVWKHSSDTTPLWRGIPPNTIVDYNFENPDLEDSALNIKFLKRSFPQFCDLDLYPEADVPMQTVSSLKYVTLKTFAILYNKLRDAIRQIATRVQEQQLKLRCRFLDLICDPIQPGLSENDKKTDEYFDALFEFERSEACFSQNVAVLLSVMDPLVRFYRDDFHYYPPAKSIKKSIIQNMKTEMENLVLVLNEGLKFIVDTFCLPRSYSVTLLKVSPFVKIEPEELALIL